MNSARCLLTALTAALCCVVGAVAPAARAVLVSGAPPSVAGQRVVFQADFHRMTIGAHQVWGWQTAAFASCVTNPGQQKLDHLTRAAAATRDGVLTITARPRSDRHWDTGLLTTGDSCTSGGSGFLERTGDLVVAHVRLPDGRAGAWPAVWSWRAGGNEVDLFEWHAGAPHRLEFVNHKRGAANLWSSPLVAPGAWLYLGVRLGADHVTWYVGTTRAGMRAVWHDNRGVGRSFAAYPVISLSVDDGSNYPPPASAAALAFSMDSFQVYR
ncbi:hypothetical protein ABIA33_000108 [Streptacidiphilus sp. MAP12-16]|uniref:beta-glucanase n=1 Tax=Streptacidiphilus sp. MAP12-16 TaxID=3156300 RepID=UPI0035119A6A